MTTEVQREGGDPRLASREKENRLILLKSRWTAPQRLRTPHLKIVREIKSREQGHDGMMAVCTFCKRLFPVDTFDVHHSDHKTENNDLSNLELACGPCNDKENAAWRARRAAIQRLAMPRQGESEHQALTQAEGQGSPELVKHNSMRPRYDRWVRDLVNGPFANQYSWPRDLLAEKAPYSCSTKLGEAFGSSKTYLKFIKEDAAFGLLNTETREGVEIVTLNKDMLKKIQKATGQ